MNKTFKKAIALLLCLSMLVLTGITAFAAEEKPYYPVTGIKISQTTLSMVYGGTAKLTAAIQPANANNTKVTWSSSNTKLVTVDANGNLTAAKDTAETPSGKQTVTITVKSDENANVKATCVVTVDNDPPTKLETLLKMLKTLYTVLTTTLAGPAKQLGMAFIDFLKKLVEVLPKAK